MNAASGRCFALVAEHHGLHVHGGAQVVGDLVLLAVGDRARVVQLPNTASMASCSCALGSCGNCTEPSTTRLSALGGHVLGEDLLELGHELARGRRPKIHMEAPRVLHGPVRERHHVHENIARRRLRHRPLGRRPQRSSWPSSADLLRERVRRELRASWWTVPCSSRRDPSAFQLAGHRGRVRRKAGTTRARSLPPTEQDRRQPGHRRRRQSAVRQQKCYIGHWRGVRNPCQRRGFYGIPW